MYNLQLCGNRRVNASVTIIRPALWVCIQWCIKCRAVGRLELPSHNTLHGLMPPLAGKWVRWGGGWGWTVRLLKINPPLFIRRPVSLAGFLPLCSSPTRPGRDAFLLSLDHQIRSRKLSDTNSAWEQELGQGHAWLPWGQTRPDRPSKVH